MVEQRGDVAVKPGQEIRLGSWLPAGEWRRSRADSCSIAVVTEDEGQ